MKKNIFTSISMLSAMALFVPIAQADTLLQTAQNDYNNHDYYDAVYYASQAVATDAQAQTLLNQASKSLDDEAFAHFPLRDQTAIKDYELLMTAPHVESVYQKDAHINLETLYYGEAEWYANHQNVYNSVVYAKKSMDMGDSNSDIVSFLGSEAEQLDHLAYQATQTNVTTSGNEYALLASCYSPGQNVDYISATILKDADANLATLHMKYNYPYPTIANQNKQGHAIQPLQPKPVPKPTPKPNAQPPVHSTLQLQEDLAEMGYLPVGFSNGHFYWKNNADEINLSGLWQEGSYNVMTKGAVMTFQEQNGIAVDGVVGTQTWAVLDRDIQQHKNATVPYTYVIVSKIIPEKLTLWENGRLVVTDLVNTGIDSWMTPDGTYPVYLRYQSQTMQGHNPDGSWYSDPGVPWISYFNGGDAIHGFIRASYGFPQSLGCVELPYNEADYVWHQIRYGTLVSIRD